MMNHSLDWPLVYPEVRTKLGSPAAAMPDWFQGCQKASKEQAGGKGRAGASRGKLDIYVYLPLVGVCHGGSTIRTR
jgi:hypothetical protein